MTNTMQVFENKDFGQVRAFYIDGQPWFIGKDVAAILGYANVSKAVTSHVDDEDKKAEMIPTAQNGKLVSRTFLINESGLYSLIFSSKLSAAKAFKRWVTSEILPSIRKRGAYIADDTLRRMREDSAFAEELLQRLENERAKTTALLDFVDRIAPKARYYDVILQCSGAVQVSIIAKDYGMTAIAFNKLLHKLGVQYKIGTTWLLYREFMNNGFTVSKTYLIDDVIASVRTCWTQKGRMWLYDVLKMYGILPEAEKEAAAN